MPDETVLDPAAPVEAPSEDPVAITVTVDASAHPEPPKQKTVLDVAQEVLSKTLDMPAAVAASMFMVANLESIAKSLFMIEKHMAMIAGDYLLEDEAAKLKQDQTCNEAPIA